MRPNIASRALQSRGWKVIHRPSAHKGKSRPPRMGTDGSIKAGALWEGEGRAPTGGGSAVYAAAFTFAVISETRFEIGAKLSLAILTTISLVFEVWATAVSNAFLLFSA